MPREGESDMEGLLGMIDVSLDVAEQKFKELGLTDEPGKKEGTTYPTTCSYCGDDVLTDELTNHRRGITLLCLCGKTMRACRKCVREKKAVSRFVLHLTSCEEVERS